jgi:hypothetical protein
MNGGSAHPALARGAFYLLCRDTKARREQDEKRILRAAGDIIENRPALSRWHFGDAEPLPATRASANS